MLHPRQGLEPIPRFEGAHEGGRKDRFVVAMHQTAPAVGQMGLALDAEEGAVATIGEDQLGRVVAHPDQGRGAVGDGAEAVLGFLQPGLGRTGLGHVEGHADEADHLRAADARPRKRLQPAPLAVMSTIAGLQREGRARGLAGHGFAQDARLVVGMDRHAPVQVARRLIAGAIEIDVGLVDEAAAPVLARHPDQDGGGVGDDAEPLFALAGLVLGAGAFDLGPGAGGDLLDQADLRLGPGAGPRGVDIEEAAQSTVADQRRADQGAGLDGVEGVGEVGGAGVLANILDLDGAAVGQVCDQPLAEGVQAEMPPGAGDAGGPVAGHGHNAGRLIDLAVADPVGVQQAAERALDLAHDLVGIGLVAQPVAEVQQKCMATFRPRGRLQRRMAVGDVEGDPGVAQEATMIVKAGTCDGAHPAPVAIGPANTRLELVGFAILGSLGLQDVDLLQVVGVDRLPPAAVGERRLIQAMQVQHGGVGELERAVGVAQPDGRGRGVGQLAKPGLALADPQQGPAQGRADRGDEEADHDEVDRGHQADRAQHPVLACGGHAQNGPAPADADHQRDQGCGPAARQRREADRRQQDGEAGQFAIDRRQRGTRDQGRRRETDADQHAPKDGRGR